MADDHHQDLIKLTRAYAAFQMATALVVASKFVDVCWANVVISLFAISIPSTVALAGYVNIPENDNGYVNIIGFFCAFISISFSVAAISLLLAPASIFAAIAFPVTCITWFAIAAITSRKKNAQKEL